VFAAAGWEAPIFMAGAAATLRWIKTRNDARAGAAVHQPARLALF